MCEWVQDRQAPAWRRERDGGGASAWWRGGGGGERRTATIGWKPARLNLSCPPPLSSVTHTHTHHSHHRSPPLLPLLSLAIMVAIPKGKQNVLAKNDEDGACRERSGGAVAAHFCMCEDLTSSGLFATPFLPSSLQSSSSRPCARRSPRPRRVASLRHAPKTCSGMFSRVSLRSPRSTPS